MLKRLREWWKEARTEWVDTNEREYLMEQQGAGYRSLRLHAKVVDFRGQRVKWVPVHYTGVINCAPGLPPLRKIEKLP